MTTTVCLSLSFFGIGVARWLAELREGRVTEAPEGRRRGPGEVLERRLLEALERRLLA